MSYIVLDNIKSAGVYTVGAQLPDGHFHPEKDFGPDERDKAERFAARMNGGPADAESYNFASAIVLMLDAIRQEIRAAGRAISDFDRRATDPMQEASDNLATKAYEELS